MSINWRKHSAGIAKGEKCPDTLATLQAAWARDQELILDQKAEISRLKATVNQLRQKRAARGKPVVWEYRTFHGDDTATPGWDRWERIQTNARYAGETVASRVAEIQDYIDRGYRYELRALYADVP